MKFLALYLKLRVCFNNFDKSYLVRARQTAVREHSKTLRMSAKYVFLPRKHCKKSMRSDENTQVQRVKCAYVKPTL